MPANPEMILDEELARLAQAGSLSDFEELVRRYETRLFRFLAQGCRNEADAADLTQETFVAAYRNLASFDSKRSFATWVFTIARRKQIDYFRSGRRAGETSQPERIDEDDPACLLAQREENENLWVRARSLLNDTQFQALWLRYAEEMPVEQIAQVLRRTRVHVKVILFRARGILARGLENYRLPEAAVAQPGAGLSPRVESNSAKSIRSALLLVQ